MKKLVLVTGVVLVTAITMAVFTFCTKQSEKEMVVNTESPKLRAKPDCWVFGREMVTVQIGPYCANLCIDCDMIKSGVIETCYQLCDVSGSDCQNYPEGTCCPYPFNLVYNGPRPATQGDLQNRRYWQWTPNNPPAGNFPPGVKVNDLVAAIPDIVEFCFNGGGTDNPDKCRPISSIINLKSGECITFDIECCGGVINGTYNIVDCNTGKPLKSDIFKAKYSGDPNDHSQVNNPDNWQWLGSTNAPSDILGALRNTWLIPCFQ